MSAEKQVQQPPRVVAFLSRTKPGRKVLSASRSVAQISRRFWHIFSGHNKRNVDRINLNDGWVLQSSCTCGKKHPVNNKHSYREHGKIQFHFDRLHKSVVGYTISKRAFYQI